MDKLLTDQDKINEANRLDGNNLKLMQNEQQYKARFGSFNNDMSRRVGHHAQYVNQNSSDPKSVYLEHERRHQNEY